MVDTLNTWSFLLVALETAALKGQHKHKYMRRQSCGTVCTTECSGSTCDWSCLASSPLLTCLPDPKPQTAPPSTCSLVTSSWRPVMASLTTCQTTWFYGSFRSSRCRIKECRQFHTLSAGRRVILLVCAHFRLPATIVSCRLHRALHSKLTTSPTTPTICPHLHSLPVIMAWMLEVRGLTHQ